MADLDPELCRQLEASRKSGKPVPVVVRLHQQAGAAPDPADVEQRTRRAVDRAAAATGQDPLDVHVMGRVGAAYVLGQEEFLRELVAQPEVAEAVANTTPQA